MVKPKQSGVCKLGKKKTAYKWTWTPKERFFKRVNGKVKKTGKHEKIPSNLIAFALEHPNRWVCE